MNDAAAEFREYISGQLAQRRVNPSEDVLSLLATARLATADISLQETVIPEGSKMMLLLGAANRDPERYADPDTLQFDRADVKPASFGGGADYCIGAMLGKMEAGLAFNYLFSNHRLELATDEPQWRPNVYFRGLAAAAADGVGPVSPRPYALSGNTLVEALDSIVRGFPDSTAAFPGTNQVLTLKALAAAADRVGSTLLDAGVQQGEVVGVLMSTRAEFLTSLFGIVRIGAVCSILPTPTGFSPAAGHIVRLARIADTARMKRIIADDTFAPAIALIAEHTTETTPVLINLKALTRDAGPLPEPPLPSDEAVVQFTSGSTADPKGVILTHGELTAGLLACVVSGEFSPDDVFTQWVPHFHDMGLVGLLSHLLNGAPVHVFSPLFFIRNADKILRHLSEQRVTVFTSPNFGYDHLCSVATPELVGELDLSAWRLPFNGAEPIRVESVERFATTFAAAGLSQSAMYPVYGMAEASLAVCFPQPGTKPRIEWVDRAELGRTGRAVPATPESQQAKGIVSVGKPVHGVEVRIVGEDGSGCGEGELGEIQISGPPVSRGYYRNAAATAESRDGNWFRTGDLGLRLDGDYFVTGRRKDMIVVRGQNYFAEDVELIAREVEGVYKQNCVAFADTRDEGSEWLTVLVEVSAKIDAHELVGQVLDKVRSSLDVDAVRVHAMPPRWIPKTTSGKWKRSAARDEIVSGTDSVIATSPASGR